MQLEGCTAQGGALLLLACTVRGERSVLLLLQFSSLFWYAGAGWLLWCTAVSCARVCLCLSLLSKSNVGMPTAGLLKKSACVLVSPLGMSCEGTK